MDDPHHVATQYADPRNLGARGSIHERFSTNPYGWHRWVFDRIERLRPKTVLDIGCGPGNLWRTQRDRLGGVSATLCDRSEGMVREASGALGGGRLSFAVTDAQHLPFPSDRFDVVVSMHMLYHVPDRAAAVAEFARVLVPGGTLLAATNGPNHMTQLRALLDLDTFTPSFDLGNGVEVLSTSFENVSCERYDDSLQVTEAEAVVDYAGSMREFWPSAMSPDDMRRHVQAVIDRDGAFVIDKDPGLFTAVNA